MCRSIILKLAWYYLYILRVIYLRRWVNLCWWSWQNLFKLNSSVTLYFILSFCNYISYSINSFLLFLVRYPFADWVSRGWVLLLRDVWKQKADLISNYSFTTILFCVVFPQSDLYSLFYHGIKFYFITVTSIMSIMVCILNDFIRLCVY